MTTTTLTATMTSTVTLITVFTETYEASLGQTVTIYPPPSAWSLEPPDTTYQSPLVSPTVTVSKLAVIVQGPSSGDVYTTYTIPVATTNPTTPVQGPPSPYVFVVNPYNRGSGWNTWSSSQQAGLIASVVIAGCLIILGVLFFWLNSRRKMWVAGDWSVASHPMYSVNQPGQMVTYGHHGWGIRGGGLDNISGGIKLKKKNKTRG